MGYKMGIHLEGYRIVPEENNDTATQDDDEMVTIEEAAKKLQISTRQVRRLVSKSGLDTQCKKKTVIIEVEKILVSWKALEKYREEHKRGRPKQKA